MDKNTVLLFTQNGIGAPPEGLQQVLVVKYLLMLRQSGQLPGAMLFYTQGVRLVCEGSLVLEHLSALEKAGVKLIVCQTCLDYFGILDQVKVGEVLGMPQILAAMQAAANVITL